MNQALLRSWVAWGARRGPDWFVSVAPWFIGALAFLFAHRVRRVVVANQRRIHGRREISIELWDTAQTFIEFARCLTEALCPERFNEKRRLIVRGRQTADEILREHGLIIATAHVGPWDSAAMMLSRLSERSVLMLMANEDDEAAAAVQDRVRSNENVRVVRLGRSPFSALSAIEQLARCDVVVAQMDRFFGRRTAIMARLFGHPFSMSSGLVRLAAVSSCPILPVFTARLSAGTHLVQVGDPIWVQARPSELQIRAALQQFLGQLESHLVQYPTQWFHFVSGDDSGAGEDEAQESAPRMDIV